MATLYLDTETTGLNPPYADLVEIAVIDDSGRRLVDELCRPRDSLMRSGWPDAETIHGINPEMVSEARPGDAVRADVVECVAGANLVIYNAQFDTGFFPLLPAARIDCAMLEAQDYFGRFKWPKLIEAAEWIGYDWQATGIKPHRAAGDALATRAVWRYMQRHQ